MKSSPCPLVLVVEDQLVVARDICTRLSTLGYEPIGTAVNSEQALALIEQRHPDIVLMDIHLHGDADGVDTARRIRERWGIPVVFLTAYAEETTLRRAKTAEPFGYIIKPFEDRDLRTAIEIALYKHKAEEALRASEERFRAVVENGPDGVFIQTDEKFAYLNNSAARLFGATDPGQLLGQPILDRLVPEDRPRSRERLRLLLQQQRAIPLAEGRCVRLDGTTFDAEASAVPFTYQGKAGALVFVRDITHRKQLESQLRQAQKMEAVGQLAGGVAHDFNNILAAVMLHLELLQRNTTLPSEVQESLRELMAQTKRASSLTRQLLLFGRRSMMDVRSLDLNEVVENLLKMLRRLIGEHIALDWQAKSQLPPVRGDAGMLEQVVMNLVVNARDALPKGGKISITTNTTSLTREAVRSNPEARPGRFVSVSVTDNGLGMSPATLKHIFEPFFTTKEVGQGTGLGLATVYGIVKQHDGWVTVQSQVDRGSVFTVFLPVTEEPNRSLPVNSDDPRALRGGHETILLVEDEPAVRKTVAAFLRRWGYEVLEAGDGLQALEVWDKSLGKVDLLFTDMVMPEGMTGLELAERLRVTKPTLRVIVTSGYSTELLYHGAEGMTAVRYLSKPCPPTELAAAIRNALDEA